MRHGIKIGGIVDNIIKEYDGFYAYVDYKIVLVKESNTLLIFNIHSTFDDGPMRVGNITSVDTSNINTDIRSIEDVYISTKTRVNDSIAPLLENGFIKLEKENISEIIAVIEGKTSSFKSSSSQGLMNIEGYWYFDYSRDYSSIFTDENELVWDTMIYGELRS
jgi:hypothetical protein